MRNVINDLIEITFRPHYNFFLKGYIVYLVVLRDKICIINFTLEGNSR